MSKRFDLLVFDWDGTLHDSIGTIVGALQSACRDLGLHELPAADARQVIGLGLAEALRRVAPELDAARYPEMAERYKHHFLARDQSLSLFDGIGPLLEALHARGHVLAVATGKSRRGLSRVLDSSGIGGLFAASRCADECFSKPHPQMLLELMDELAVEPARTLMIGDTTHDIEMAVNAGVSGVAVTYGAHPVDQLVRSGAMAHVDTVAELAAWLDANA